MAVTTAQVDTAVEAVIAYIQAGNYEAAKKKWDEVEVMIAAMPDYGRGSTNVRYDRAALDRVRKLLETRERDAISRGGFQTLADFRTGADGE